MAQVEGLNGPNGGIEWIKWKELDESNGWDLIDKMGGNEWIKWEGMTR